MSSILTSKSGNYGTISFNRPDKYNSFNREMALACQDALDEMGNDENIRAIMITGIGKAFSAGQDITEILDPNGPDISKIIQEHFNPVVKKIRAIEKPIIAAVNGVAAGAGANIALSCDVVIAHEQASFMQAFSKIGLIPDSGGTFFLPRLIGFQKASALMMLGDKIPAQEAESMGMVYKVVDAENFEAYCQKILVTLANMPTKGLALTKMALNESMSNNYDQQLELEDKYQSIAGASEDYWEGIKAFVEKRKPVFKGK